jgi:hypothetical protein
MALDLVDWSPLMKQIGGLGDTLAENRLLQNRASRGKLVQSGNYNQAAQAAFADGAIDEATQYQGLQRQHDQDAWTRQRAERQDARDAASTALTNQLTGLKIKEAEDDLGAKLKTRVAGIAQTILAETDPQKRAGMWSRFVGADKRIGDGLREYGVDPADVETGAKYLIAEAGGSATAKPIEVNGRLVQRMGDGSYKEVYSSPPKPAQLMASDRKEVYESDDSVRAGRRVVNAEYDVLLTAEEVTAQAVEAQQAAEAAATAATEQAAAEQRKQAALTSGTFAQYATTAMLLVYVLKGGDVLTAIATVSKVFGGP